MLEIDSLSCSYGTAQILNHISLSVGDGEVVALLGRNGMGKTTLVRCLFGMQPPAIDAGSIRLNGDELVNLSSHKIAQQGIALVPQGRRVFGSLTVKENLTVASSSAGQWTLNEIFEFFPQLEARVTSRAAALSGGEQQMLAIARALMTNPQLLVMDEASEGLAPIIIKEIQERLELLKEEGLTVFVVEQNVGLALSLADRIYVLGSRGSIAWMGTPEDFKNATDMQQTHLGV